MGWAPERRIIAARLNTQSVWPLGLWSGDVIDADEDLVGASLLALVNTALGTAVHRGLLRLVRRTRAALEEDVRPTRPGVET